MNQIVNVNDKSVAFCRYTIAVLFVIIAISGLREFLMVPFIIMLLSAILGVKKAPLVVIGDKLFKKSESVTVSVQSIRFAHFVGSVFTLLTMLFYFVFKIDIVGHIFLGILVFLQIVAAFGYCSAQKLYECVIIGNNCCNLGKKVRACRNVR